MSERPPSATALPPPGADDVLYIVDISGYLFRAYHALPPLSSPSGEPTHAVLGVVTMLGKLIGEQQPARIAIALDSPGPSFRKELFDQYKANRPPAPEDLRQQLLRLKEIVGAYRLPAFECAGVEADDVIASLTSAARAVGLRVVIVSSDKDLMQLIDEGVCMYDTARSRVYGEAETVEKLGVKPEKVRDLLALTGDSSDNVPGVPSVGPKTAVQLLAQYGDLDGIYAHVGEVKRKALREKLEANRDQAYLSQRLVSLKDDVALGLPQQGLAEQLARPEPDTARLIKLFSELGFARQLSALSQGRAVEAKAPAPKQAEPCRLVLDDAGLGELCDAFAPDRRCALFCVTEGHAVSGALVGIALAVEGDGFYVPLGHNFLGCPEQLDTKLVLERLRGALEDAAITKTCADAKRETMWLLASGVELSGVDFDAALASYLIDSDRHAHRLTDIARFELQRSVETSAPLLERTKGEPASSERAPGEVAAMAGEVLDVLEQSRQVLVEKLDDDARRLLREMELPLCAVLARMELCGIRVDSAHLRRLSQRVAEDLVALEAKCIELAGQEFNVASPRQLETILFDKLELPVIKRTKTARSTDQSVLEELSLHHELPATILEHRMLAKLKSTYLDALPREVNPRTGRIHTDFRQAVAATGRLSSSDPNLQNIPVRSEVGRSIRDAFVAREGWSLLSVDYSQIELRVLAHLSHDPALVEAFQEGSDIHRRTAKAIFGVDEGDVTREMRGQAKTVNFAVIYGQTQFALARNLRIERSEAARYIKAFFAQYAGVARYMDSVVRQARGLGYVQTLCGRRRYLPDLASNNRVKRQAAERVARNTPIQGTAADIIKLAMVAIDHEMRERALSSRMLLTVHDELVFEAPDEEHDALEGLARERMEHALELDVPLTVDFGWGKTWGAAH